MLSVQFQAKLQQLQLAPIKIKRYLVRSHLVHVNSTVKQILVALVLIFSPYIILTALLMLFLIITTKLLKLAYESSLEQHHIRASILENDTFYGYTNACILVKDYPDIAWLTQINSGIMVYRIKTTKMIPKIR